MKFKSLSFAATSLCASLVGVFPTATQAEIPLFIFAGQSNMVGYGATVDELVGPLLPYSGPQSRVKFWGPNSSVTFPSWGDLTAPTELVGVYYPYKAFGPEVSTGKDIAETLGYPRVAIVKHSLGATSLAPAAGWDWAPSSTNELTQQLYSRYQSAAYWMPAALGDTGRVSAFFWMQGETDASDALNSVYYQARLQEFIHLARLGYGQPSLPFIMGQVNASLYATYWNNVQAAQVAVARADPRAALVLTDDLPRMADDLHYTTAGIVELGLRFAHAYRQFALGTPGAGLLVNPGFEAQRITSFVGIPSQYNGGSTVSGALQGWSDSGAGVTLVRSHAFGVNTALASQGSQWLSLKNGYLNGGNGSVTQRFVTVPGSTYTVAYDCAALSGGNGASSRFQVTLNGAIRASHTLGTAGTAAFHMTPWTTNTFVFTATATSTELGFASLDPADGTFFGAGIDNVRVY
jgi:hypothetical protein